MMFIYGESSNDIHHPRTEKRPEHRDGSHKSRRCRRQSACAAAVRVERSRHGLSGSSVWSFGLRSSLIVCPRDSVALDAIAYTAVVHEISQRDKDAFIFGD